MNVGIVALTSNCVCNFIAALCWRNFAHQNTSKHKSTVVESTAYKLPLTERSTSEFCRHKTIASEIRNDAESANIRQSRFSFAYARFDFDKPDPIPRWYHFLRCAVKPTTKIKS